MNNVRMEAKRDRKRRVMITDLLIVVSVSAFVAYGYFKKVDEPNLEPRLELHESIIHRIAPSPYRYRILVPVVAEATTQAFSRVLPRGSAFLVTYAIYDFLAIFFLLASLLVWLQFWFSREQALTGVLFVACTMPIALQNHYFQPWSLLEAGLFTASLIAIYRERYWLLSALVVVAALNRETAVFIPLAFLLTRVHPIELFKRRSGQERRWLLITGGNFLLWGVIYVGIRFFQGSAPHLETIKGLLAQNTTADFLYLTFINATLFFGFLWVFAILGFKFAPAFIRRLALIIPPYLVTIMVWGVWYEVRLLMPLYPVLLPLALSFVYRERAPGMSEAYTVGFEKISMNAAKARGNKT